MKIKIIHTDFYGILLRQCLEGNLYHKYLLKKKKYCKLSSVFHLKALENEVQIKNNANRREGIIKIRGKIEKQ